ncbi:major facilitator superfamily MFS_1 [Coriobacterium glomerans PW2]|uniref:Major facilitator superfamily MFS_1 n=1 Tax=Coriobacterium glomerans (strain ATCC 49209 / DSM 20642 / JCM 10262 / PW2) TaxID=700015 RepID=F2N932_CORGP|nr:MFS transporter [Coriobacterium glomerans]AEB07708.1 major facilitator superfamily MFS_1 [Coriobacterium glomerans PW2]
MADPIHDGAVASSALAPDTGKPLPASSLVRFALGFILFGGMWMMSDMIGAAVLLPQRFVELFPGQAEAVLGTMNSFGSIFALIANVVFGALSDATRSRFGKRTPWIACGGFIAGIAFWLTSVQTSLVGIAVFWSILQVGLNMMIAPAMPILSDRIPLMRRGTISAFYGAGVICGQSLGTIIGSAFITDIPAGVVFGVISWFLTGLLVVIIWPRERSAALAQTQRSDRLSPSALLKSFIPSCRGCRDFYLALVGRFLFVFGYFVIGGYQLYILERFIGLGEIRASQVLSILSLIIMVVSLVTSLTSGVISDKIGRRKPLVAVASVLIAIGFAVPWLVHSVASMYIYAALSGIGYGVYSSVDQALNVDVLPSREQAGKDLGILNIANTAGQVFAPVVTSSIVLITSSYALTFPFAICFIMLGVVFIMLIRGVA